MGFQVKVGQFLDEDKAKMFIYVKAADEFL
jgi:hypothetical protein